MLHQLQVCLLMVVGMMGMGCVAVERRTSALVGGGSTPSCHPSQYWDGHQCRHKGQGQGARKHDGRKK
jgi:hypothetical protein